MKSQTHAIDSVSEMSNTLKNALRAPPSYKPLSPECDIWPHSLDYLGIIRSFCPSDFAVEPERFDPDANEGLIGEHDIMVAGGRDDDDDDDNGSGDFVENNEFNDEIGDEIQPLIQNYIDDGKSGTATTNEDPFCFGKYLSNVSKATTQCSGSGSGSVNVSGGGCNVSRQSNHSFDESSSKKNGSKDGNDMMKAFYGSNDNIGMNNPFF